MNKASLPLALTTTSPHAIMAATSPGGCRLFELFKKTEQGVRRTKEAWFGKITRLLERPAIEAGLWDELEELLVAADVGVSTTAKLIERVKKKVDKEQLLGASQIRAALKEEMVSILRSGVNPGQHLAEAVAPSGPRVILVVGVNGVGKTTSIAKLANSFREHGEQVIIAAADTFRAAANEQLRLWGERAGAEVVAHQPGADPGAVVFDALEAARGRHAKVVIIDTAGRLHTKFNLMEELKKIKRVAAKIDPSAPHEVLLVLDATTGQNGLSQAKYFTEAVGVTGIFLAKLDGTAKGGIVLAICDELKIPILYIGTGEKLDDIAPFDSEEFVEALFS